MTSTVASPHPVRRREHAYDALARRDDGLARLVARHGAPDPFFWGVLEQAAGGDAFAELALHIVSQQISTAAALTIARLRDMLGGTVRPAPIIAASVDDLRAAGLSGAKARFHARPRRTRSRRPPLVRPARRQRRRQGAGRARRGARRRAVVGADVPAAHLRRPDVFPAADLGLLRAAQSAFALARRPTADELAARAEQWRPFRSYAAALLWAHGADRPATRSET